MNITINSFIYKTADKMRKAGQYNAAKTCMSALNGLLKTAEKSTLRFSELTPALLKAYEHRLIAQNRNRNTVSLYMRTLKYLCNRAREEHVTQLSASLFENVFTGYEPSLHRAVTSAIIKQIRDFSLIEKDHRLTFSRDMFMLSFYLRGIPFVDLAHLRKCDLRNGVITYHRSKTKRQTSVLVEPCALEIISRYAPSAKDSPYLLPIIRRSGNATEEQKQYESALRLYNKHLNLLSCRMELKIRLTSYVARHSWATMAHDIGINVADISAALCHSTEKMTQVYLQSFTPDRLANVNHQVISCIGIKCSKTKKRSKNFHRLSMEEFCSGSL